MWHWHRLHYSHVRNWYRQRITMTFTFGSHCSIAGGYYKAIEEAHSVGCECVQIFTKNNNQWKAKPITEDEVHKFRTKLDELEIVQPLSHASYLINLASPDDELWNKSIEAMVIEWQRAEQLGLIGVVVHPGAFVSSNEQAGLLRIRKALPKIYKLAKPKSSFLLLENTAGQGSCLGWNMEQLGYLLEESGADLKVGVCIDSCHAHSAGYDLSTPAGLKKLIAEGTQYNVLEHVRAIHLNDSKREAGSRVDRHEHIGFGTLTLEGIQRFIKHKAFKNLPMYLETEKGDAEDGRPWDVVNLETVRGLV